MIFWNAANLPLRIDRGGLWGLVISSVISRMAMILVGIFSSVYIYEITQKMGYSLVESANTIIFFFVSHFVAKIFFLLWAEDLSRTHGFKAVIRYSAIPYLFFLLFIYLGKNSLPLLFLAGMFWGAEAGFYWWGYHGLFSKLAKRGSVATSISKADVAFTIGALVTPVIGALLIDYYGFGYLMLASAVLMVISVLFLGIDHDIKQKHDVKVEGIAKSLRKNKSLVSLYASRGSALSLQDTIWPLYIFLILGSVLDLGLIISASTLITSLLMIYVGKYVDKHGEKRVLSAASFMVSLSWGVRSLFSGIFAFVTTDVMNGFGLRMYQVSLDEIAYKRADKTSTAEALLIREAGLLIGAISILLISSLIITLTGNIIASFIVAIFFATIPLLVKNKNGS